MSPLERLRWAVAPVQGRSLALFWGGIAGFVASGAISFLPDLPGVVLVLIYCGMLASWLICALGTAGYLRCLFGQASAEMRKIQAERQRDE